MAVRIRLSRIGKKHRPYWRIVAVDSHAKRDGKCLENLGTYDSLNGTLVTFKPDQINKWVSKGAQCSTTVTRLMKMHRRLSKAEDTSKSKTKE